MKTNDYDRRSFLRGSITSLPACAAAPLMLTSRSIAKGYTRAEAEGFFQGGASPASLTRHDLLTPALILDLHQFEANLSRMASHARGAGVNLRPHAKTHKCPEIAHRQIEAGAVGQCVANIGEAEAMGGAGIPGILLTSETVGKRKMERFMKLAARHRDMAVVVDNAENVVQFGQAAETFNQQVNVLVDVDVGSRRTGVAPGKDVLEIAQAIVRTRGLKFGGIHAYAGHAAHVVGFDKRKDVSTEAMGRALETKSLLERNGIEVPLLTGGSTGTYNIDSQMKGISELQVGSYVFMDLDYRRIGGQGGERYEDFGCALTVLTTVISRPGKNRAVTEGGYKAFSTDKPFTPECKTVRGITFSWGGDEHGKLDLTNAEREVRLGDRLEFIIPHCDPNVNLYDRLYAVRGEKVEAVWPIAARGYAGTGRASG